jgi:hypothetical protein
MLMTILLKQGTVISNSEKHLQDTQRAFLVAWGWFAEHLSLIEQLQAEVFGKSTIITDLRPRCWNCWWL